MTGRFDRFLGVDFSAAKDAGDRIWIAMATPRDSRLAVAELIRARDLPGGGRRLETALTALRRFLGSQDRALVGLDFPFSLPAPLIDEADWPAFALGFDRRYPDPDAFRDACRRRAGGREWRRRTDREALTPFAAYNLRLYRQTYWGIAAVLAPLVRAGRVAIAPMHRPPGASTVLAEICPASTLKRLGCYGGYKGIGAAPTAARIKILVRLRAEGLACGENHADTARADSGGDALDAMIACLAAWRVAEDSTLLRPRDRLDAIEARVWF